MNFKQTDCYRYWLENRHKFLVWFIFFFVTSVIVFLAIKILAGVHNETVNSPKSTVEEVKVFFPATEPDTLLNVIENKLVEIQETIDSMRKDSITVSIQKISK